MCRVEDLGVERLWSYRGAWLRELVLRGALESKCHEDWQLISKHGECVSFGQLWLAGV